MKRGLVSVNRHMTGAKPSHDRRNDAKLIQDITINIRMLRHYLENKVTDIIIKIIRRALSLRSRLLKTRKRTTATDKRVHAVMRAA